MLLDSEETSFTSEKSTEEKLIASLLVFNQSVENTPVDLKDLDGVDITSERWRDSICTAVRRNGNTEVSSSPTLRFSRFSLLSDSEKEQIQLRRVVSNEYSDRRAPETFKSLLKRARRFSVESNESRSTQSPRRLFKQLHTMVSEESQTNEENFVDSNQLETIVSKEFASQTCVGGLGTFTQSEPVESKESASQTTDPSLDISQQTEPVISKECASQTIADSSDSSRTSEVTKSIEPIKEIPSNDHVFALPAVPPPRSSNREAKTGKESKNDNLSVKSKTASEAESHSSGRKTSKDTPDPRRRSSRLSSRSCSEKDEDSESNDEKTSVKSASKSKRGKKLESSGAESDEGRSTPATRASRRLKK